MIQTHTSFKSPRPEQQDMAVAAQTVSVMVAVAALWLFVSPWAYGFSIEASSWNAWGIGAVMFVFSCLRLLAPMHTSGFSRMNAALAVWVFFSPWIYGYAQQGPRLTNSLSIGVFVFALSLVSAKASTSQAFRS